MNKLQTWGYIIVAVLIALLANYISTIWATKESKFTSVWFLALVLISPLVFITFGLVTSRVGLTVTSGTVDALLTISTIIVGLFVLNEWSTFNMYQFFGIILSLLGIILMQFGK